MKIAIKVWLVSDKGEHYLKDLIIEVEKEK